MTSVQKTKRIRIGDVIKQRKEKYNGIESLPIRGVTREGFIPPKQKDADTSIYNVFYKNDFVFNPARMELNSIALNKDIDKGICSSLYEIFYVYRTDIILPEYLNMFIKRDEFARMCWFYAIGSARNYFRVPDLSDFELDVPPIEIQKKYVAIYESLMSNMLPYQSNIDDLKLVCDSFIEQLRKDELLKQIGGFISFRNEKNTDEKIKLEQGINIQKEFIVPQRGNSNLKGRKIVRHGDIAYCTQLNNENVAIAYREGPDCVVSSVYDVFYVNDEETLNPKYLLLWLNRHEFGRYVYWMSTGTSYEFLDYRNICDYKIPIPDIKIQQSIVDIYETIQRRKRIRDELKKTIDKICPVLIRGSVIEAKGGKLDAN